MTHPTIILIVLCIVLAVHYVSQKLILARGWQVEDAKPHIKRLIFNGVALIVVAITALIVADYPYGLIGILLFIEAAVCFSFARKLSRK